MKPVKLRFRNGFAVVAGNKHSEAATMVIPAGEKEGGKDNNHKGADQWLFVVSGKGYAMVDGKNSPCAPSSLILIERGQNHEIRNTGTTELVTLNFYVPPAYTKAGDDFREQDPDES
jgi:mannose-6-phosphate isomerase-like protein (cupin superfamily)